MTTTITLQGKVPSKKNSKRRVQRGAHVFMVPSKAHEDWHTVQMWALKGHKHIAEPGLITLTFYPPDRRPRDLTNSAESIMDLLVDAGILEDDNWFVCGAINLRFGGVDKAAPRAVVQID